MTGAPALLQVDQWEAYQFSQNDLEFINNYLFELETPQTTQELLKAVIQNRLEQEKKSLQQKQLKNGRVYLPKDHYEAGEQVQFPSLGWRQGKVTKVRAGNNPEISSFNVMDVEFTGKDTRSFAVDLEEHALNTPVVINEESQTSQVEEILAAHGETLEIALEESLATDPNLALITGAWFPRALFVDINIGQLNLAEAILDMAGGGPLSTASLMEQLDLPPGVNEKLTEFSLNLALQEDPRFDEVGSSGDVLWYLERLEPENVRQAPLSLQFQIHDVDRSNFTPQLSELEKQLDDEYCSTCFEYEKKGQADIILTYPHWRAGSLPLSSRTRKLFPTALESPRIQFSFIDADTKEKIPGWVVRPNRYVVGLSEWYQQNGLIPGSIITIHKANSAGEVLIKVEKKKSKEWLRTVLVGADGGIVFALLKQQVNTTYDERMATVVPDVAGLDKYWETQKVKRPHWDNIIVQCAQELTKLNPQGHVHAQELYAAANVFRRCSPEIVFNVLVNSPAFSLVGDLYYRLVETGTQET